eukprot:TRINITY_DN63655_c0_g1_i1.p1 TRINITY_DN63655_c0_g1~~TRINITY_DN63655_c0_g1_i1.p1  ORF type:complete len:325 (+),score=62.39 TRINITY_DN63655_c0_g1_i1:35-1009(+)
MASKHAPLPAAVRRQHWRRTVSAVGLAAAASVASTVTSANFVATGPGSTRRELLSGLLLALQGGDAASAADEPLPTVWGNAKFSGQAQECRDSCLKDWCRVDPRSCDCHSVLAAEGYSVPRSAPEAIAAADGVSNWDEALHWRAATAPGWPAAREEALVVKDSTIPGAGKGLFAAEPLAAGTVISAYLGKQLTAEEAQAVRTGPPQEVTEYMWCPFHGNGQNDDSKGAAVQTNSYCVDAKPQIENNPARYVNAAAEDEQCKLWNLEMCELGQVMYYRTKMAVQAGAELVTDYGPNYWDVWEGCTRRKSSESRVVWNWLKSLGIV